MSPRILMWSIGGANDPSSQYRVRFAADILRAQGADIEPDPVGPIINWNREWSGSEPPANVEAVSLAKRPDADVIVMLRPNMRWWADVIPMVQAQGIRVVVDVDDLFDDIHVGNRARADYDGSIRATHHHYWVNESCKRANIVTATTQALKTRYGHGHGIVIPNLVPESYLKVDAETLPETIGWSGNVGVHPNDLQVTHGSVQRVLSQTGWKFHVIGTGNRVKEVLGLRDEPTATGYVPLVNYPEHLAALELGIVPLADTPFNRAKSCLKLVEMSAVGVPVLASATPDNARMARAGVGEVVTDPQHWRRQLRKLVASTEYRADLAGRSRAAMADHTYEEQAWRWGYAWGLDKGGM